MRVGDLGDCARPLLFENEDEDYAYTFGGTCFLVFYGQHLFGVTAAHVVSNHQYEVKDIRIPPTFDNPRDFLPLRRVFRFDPADGGGTDYCDILILEINQAQLDPLSVNSLGAHDIAGDVNTPLSLHKGARLLIRGYPGCINSIDYAKKYVGSKALMITGIYREKSALEANCHLFDFDGLTDAVAGANGMSGSPIFQVEQQQKGSLARLVGLLTKGDDVGNLGYFVDASVLTEMLQRASDRLQ
jgi:hypothetical protein